MVLAKVPLIDANNSPGSSIRPDDATHVARRRQLQLAGEGHHAPILRKYIEILVSRAGIEEHDPIARLQEPAMQEMLVSGQRCTSFGTGEDAFGRSQLLDPVHDVVIANG